MKFLRTLLWVVIAALVTMLAARNWRDVTILLWGDLQADIKIPVLMLIMFLLGLLPAWLVYRARYWRRVRSTVPAPARVPPPDEDRGEATA
jgi:uncharacterized membrane protein YciS (DUF1049 family)